MSEASEQGAAVVPLAREANEGLYFRLLLKGLGLDPKGFRFWRFAHQQGRRMKVRVFGRRSAAVYVGSYVGVPIPDANGELTGTLCHFDFKEHPISDDEFRLLERLAQTLSPHLGVVEQRAA